MTEMEITLTLIHRTLERIARTLEVFVENQVNK